MKTVALIFAGSLLSVAVNLYLKENHTSVNVKQIYGITSWDHWTQFSDSSHTVVKTVSFDIFPSVVNFIFVKDAGTFFKNEFNYHYPDFGTIDQHGYATTISSNSAYPNHVFVVIPHSAKNDVNVKSHEVSHAADQIMSRLGINDSEVKAYLVGYMMEEIETVPDWEQGKFSVIIK